MKKRIILISTLVAVLVLTTVFVVMGQQKTNEEPYGYARDTMEELVGIYQQFIDDVEEAETAQEIAEAIGKFTDSIEKIEPKLIEMEGRYPELGEMEELPELLEEVVFTLDSMGEAIMFSFYKILEYAEDPAVMAALERLN